MSIKPRVIPFRIGKPIKDPADFVGRRDVLQGISTAMLNLQNVSLHGERRTGKTSLLLYLSHPTSSSYIGLPRTHIPVYFDFQRFTTSSPTSVWQAIAEAVAGQIKQRHPDRQAESEQFLATVKEFLAPPEAPEMFGTGFGRALSHLDASGFKIHLLLDEFDQTSRNYRLGDPFYDTLRSLTTRAENLSYIIASRVSLSEIQPTDNKVSSPLFNIFTSITLGPFQKDEVYHLIFDYFARAELDLSLAEKLCSESLLYSMTGYHPFFLQALCYHLCTKLDEPDWPRGQALEKALQAFEKDAEEHFDYYWDHSSPEEQELLKTLASKQPIDREIHRAPIKSLKNRCLVVQTDEADYEWNIFSSAFSNWVNLITHIPTTTLIPAGPFWIGSLPNDPEAVDNEKPNTRLDLPEYQIGRYPITNAQYARFARGTGHRSPKHWSGEKVPPGLEDHPVTDVSHSDAEAYCRWLSQVTGENYRLPTEMEWEKAARGSFPETRRYPWGNKWRSDLCNTREMEQNGTTSTHEFEQDNQSPFGVVDMAGNVWEWTASWYERYPGSPHESSSYGHKFRVVRGGAWDYPAHAARISCRGRHMPNERRPDLGFRVVLDQRQTTISSVADLEEYITIEPQETIEQEATTEQQDTQPSEPSPELEPLTPAEPEGGYRFEEGTLIADRYKVIAPLGFGGFSQVYHCEDTRIGRDIAIKVLAERKDVNLQEARAGGILKHDHIIQVYDVLRLEDDTPVIIFDHIAGETLEKALEQAQYRRLPLDADTLRIIHQVAEALDYAHSRNVIHRDVKPSNIILDEQGKAYLTDFGLAEAKLSTETKRSALTVGAIELGGTVPYMAPERLAEEDPGDKRSDIYSLGIVAYEMLTGQLPYRGRTGSLIAQIVTGDPFPPTKANPDLPLGVESVLLWAIDRDPDKRPSSCLVFADELKQAARAYVEAVTQYALAKEVFEGGRWRQALDAFEVLESQAPSFKDAAHYLEQARSQVRLLELYEKAQGLLEQGEYQDVLDTLNNLTQLDPEYDVADLRQQARENLAREIKEALDAQYRQAVRQFKNEEYEACLDTLAVIYTQDADYSDPDGIVEPARAQSERQRRLRELYNRGVKQMGQEQWEGAIAAFQELQEEEPGYEDVENQLASARLLAKVSLPLQEAEELLNQEEFVACVDKLEELRQIDDNYKRDEVKRLRKEALNLLYRQTNSLLEEEKFKDSLVALTALQQRSPDHPGVEELEAQAREGIRIQDLRAKLDGLYQQAVKHLNQREHAKALELWQKIQQQQEDLEYPDQWNVEGRAKEGFCMRLYNQALAALTKEDFDQVLELWQQVLEVDSAYPDSQQVEQQARAMQFYNQALDALVQENPHQALTLLRQAREANPNHSDKQRVEQRAQAMMLYSQAQEALNQGDAHQALELLRQTRQVYHNYPDRQQIKQQSQAMNLYGQAVEALTQDEPRRALELLQQVRAADPHYPDKHQIEQQAQVMIEEIEKHAKAQNVRRWAIRLGGGAAVLALLVVLIVVVVKACGGPIATATPTLIPSPTLTTAPSSATPTVTPSPTRTPTPTPTLSPGIQATALQEAGIFVAPDANSQTIDGVAAGEQVIVLGRSQYEEWFYVRDDQGVEGFVYAPLFDWAGDFELLPIMPSTITPSPGTATTDSHPPLELELWYLNGYCAGGAWYRDIYMGARGGDGVFMYYWNDELKCGPQPNQCTFEIRSAGGGIIGIGKVVSGDGQEIERAIYVHGVSCP